MSRVQTRPILKLKYFNCRKGSDHEGQALNYVCVQKSCKQKGLICSVCKHDHNNHNVVPLKYLLSSLKNHKQNPMQSESFQTQLQELQQLKNCFLYDLKEIVEKLSEKFRKIQEDVIEQFKKKKVELLNQIQINMKFNSIIDETLNNNLGDQDIFEKDFRVIASLIDNQPNKKKDPHSSNNFSFTINLNKIIAEYKTNYESFSTKINKFLADSDSQLNSLLQQKIAPPADSEEKNSLGLNQSLEYKFNQKAKGSNIKILTDNKTAECLVSGSQRFALIDGPVYKKGSSIRFKVSKLKNWVGLGIAIRNNIVGKKYQFTYNSIGHGSFLLSNNSYSWSHAFAANNIQNSNFTFLEGQIIKVQVTQKELIFTNESQGNKVSKLPILLNEEEWKQVCFCVNLCSNGDSVTIL